MESLPPSHQKESTQSTTTTATTTTYQDVDRCISEFRFADAFKLLSESHPYPRPSSPTTRPNVSLLADFRNINRWFFIQCVYRPTNTTTQQRQRPTPITQRTTQEIEISNVHFWMVKGQPSNSRTDCTNDLHELVKIYEDFALSKLNSNELTANEYRDIGLRLHMLQNESRRTGAYERYMDLCRFRTTDFDWGLDTIVFLSRLLESARTRTPATPDTRKQCKQIQQFLRREATKEAATLRLAILSRLLEDAVEFDLENEDEINVLIWACLKIFENYTIDPLEAKDACRFFYTRTLWMSHQINDLKASLIEAERTGQQQQARSYKAQLEKHLDVFNNQVRLIYSSGERIAELKSSVYLRHTAALFAIQFYRDQYDPRGLEHTEYLEKMFDRYPSSTQINRLRNRVDALQFTVIKASLHPSFPDLPTQEELRKLIDSIKEASARIKHEIGGQDMSLMTCYELLVFLSIHLDDPLEGFLYATFGLKCIPPLEPGDQSLKQFTRRYLVKMSNFLRHAVFLKIPFASSLYMKYRACIKSLGMHIDDISFVEERKSALDRGSVDRLV